MKSTNPQISSSGLHPEASWREDAFFTPTHNEESVSNSAESSTSTPDSDIQDEVQPADDSNSQISLDEPSNEDEFVYVSKSGGFTSEGQQESRVGQASSTFSYCDEKEPLIATSERPPNAPASTVGYSTFYGPQHSSAPTSVTSRSLAEVISSRSTIMLIIVSIGKNSNTVRNAIPTSILHIFDEYVLFAMLIFAICDYAYGPIGVLDYLSSKFNRARLYVLQSTPKEMLADLEASAIAPIGHKLRSLLPPPPSAERLPSTEKDLLDTEPGATPELNKREKVFIVLVMLSFLLFVAVVVDMLVWMLQVNALLMGLLVMANVIAKELKQPPVQDLI